MAERKWYRLHAVTWAAVLAVAGALVWCQVSCETSEGRIAGRLGGGPLSGERFGWPWCYRVELDFSWPPLVSRAALAGNIAVWAAMTLCVTAVVEGSVRRPAPWFRFRLSTLFSAMAVIAVLLAVLRNGTGFPEINAHGASVAEDGRTLTREIGGRIYTTSALPLVWRPWPVLVSTVFAMGCTTYAAGWVAVSLGGRVKGGRRR